MRRDPENVDPARVDFHQEQHVEAAQEIVSRWKKSQANSPLAWARKNLLQDVSAPRGARPIRSPRKIRRTVESLTR
jgi:hypothetical protein